MMKNSNPWLALLGGSLLLLSVGCTSLKTPATADVAVSKAAVDNAAAAGGVQFAPVEMTLAREKMVRANAAMADKNYELATELATAAQADAKLAQSKADSAKAQAAATALQDDIKVLREELNRNLK
jgi:hypothetical protein